MDKEHLKGAAQKLEGAVKSGVGKAVGNDRLHAEGESEKMSGRLHEAAGDIKDAGSKLKDAVKR